MKHFTYSLAGGLLLGLLLVLAGCATLAPSAAVPITSGASNEASGPATVGADQIANPIAAFDFSQCGGALVLYVVIDATHVMRFDQKQTTIFVFENGKMSETSGPPTPFKDALSLAEQAGITSNAIAPCGKPEVET